MSGPGRGDRVRVTLEGEVRDATPEYLDIKSGTRIHTVWHHSPLVVSVEILPPVQDWQPGDIVLDAAGRTWKSISSDHYPWRGFDGDDHPDASPLRPLTLLVRDGQVQS